MNRVYFIRIVYFFFTYAYKKLLHIYIDRPPFRYSNQYRLEEFTRTNQLIGTGEKQMSILNLPKGTKPLEEKLLTTLAGKESSFRPVGSF